MHESNYQKNPFDRQFELARKQNLNPLRYAPSISNLNQTSPLNTPSISLNDGATPWILPTPSLVTSSLSDPAEVPKTSTEDIPPQISTAKANNPRSNVVSVICPPSATSKTSEASSENSLTVKSAPVIGELERNNAAKGPEDGETLSKVETPKSAPELSCLRSYPRKNKLLDPITLLVSLPGENPPQFPVSTQANSCLPSNGLTSDLFSSTNENLANLIKIVPKLDGVSATKPSNISSLPAKRKEKTEEELLSRLKATEAALPPKAKPGRKSRTAAEENVKDRKKRSLERNRAAAMRCRLKKKKEVDELKTKVESYEQQNMELRVRGHVSYEIVFKLNLN